VNDAKIRAAVIGYGGAFNMGKHHADWMIAAGMDFVAACDSDPNRTAAAEREFPGIRTYNDYRELLADPKVDLVVIILPHNLHNEVSIEASRAGKHVVVEKPMCLSVKEADEMIAAATEAGKMLTIFHNRRWDADYMQIREIIDQGLIGDIVHLELHNGGFSHPGDWWRSNKQISGGILFDWGVHMVDWTVNIIGSEVKGVFGNLYKGVWPGVTNEDHGQMLLKFANGAVADIQISQLSSVPKTKWRILGTKGGITADWGTALTVKVDHEGHLASFDIPLRKDHWQGYYDNIAGALMRGEKLVVTAEEARRNIAIIEAAEKSAASGAIESPA
jgi:predicted dehydrogenase